MKAILTFCISTDMALAYQILVETLEDIDSCIRLTSVHYTYKFIKDL